METNYCYSLGEESSDKKVIQLLLVVVTVGRKGKWYIHFPKPGQPSKYSFKKKKNISFQILTGVQISQAMIYNQLDIASELIVNKS